jgi:hypothetical protein
MTDRELAVAIIDRLNALIVDEAIREDVGKLIDTRIAASQATANHPSIQVQDSHTSPVANLGFLGLLNGIVGVVPEGPNKGWGYIGSTFNVEGKLLRFIRMDTKT